MDKELYLKNLKDYLHLISLYLNKKEEPSFKIDESNFPFFLKLSKHHSLTALFYKAVKDTKVDIKEELSFIFASGFKPFVTASAMVFCFSS